MRLDALARKGIRASEKAVLRSRREVVQHAAAFQHIVAAFVKDGKPMSEALIKETHGILMRGISGEDAGVFNTKDLGGTYRKGDERAYAGTTQFTTPANVPNAMRSMVESLQADIATIEREQVIDPWVLAARYCDRFVNIHPFKDGNGRMCRLILNAILLKYVGFVVALGEKESNRDAYLIAAQESSKVGGHPGYLATMVLDSAGGTLKRLKAALKRKGKSTSS